MGQCKVTIYDCKWFDEPGKGTNSETEVTVCLSGHWEEDSLYVLRRSRVLQDFRTTTPPTTSTPTQGPHPKPGAPTPTPCAPHPTTPCTVVRVESFMPNKHSCLKHFWSSGQGQGSNWLEVTKGKHASDNFMDPAKGSAFFNALHVPRTSERKNTRALKYLSPSPVRPLVAFVQVRHRGNTRK